MPVWYLFWVYLGTTKSGVSIRFQSFEIWDLGSLGVTGGYVGSLGTFPSYLYNLVAPLTRKGSTSNL